ncbi:MAG TPA: TIR domain-containing protein [Alphaproteobacteria bacterium]|nr:TIR domain-containing protein [Alphaproteobacteria bacterium]
MSDLFISYSRLDLDRVEKLAQALERAGLSVWWDRRIKSGDSFDRVIEHAIAEAKAVIVAWSRHSTDSSWVRAEAGFALEKSKLVPVRLDDASPPLRFLHVHTIDLSAWDGSTISGECAKLIADLKEIVGAAGTPGAAATGAEAIGAPVEPAERREAAKGPPARARNKTIAVAALAAGVLLAVGLGFLVLRGGKNDVPAKETATADHAAASGVAPMTNAVAPAEPKATAPPAELPAATAGKPAAPSENEKMAPALSASTSPPATPPSREPVAQPAGTSAPPAAAPESAPAPSGKPPPSAPSTTVPAVNPAADHQIEIAFWESIKDSKNAAELEAYLQKYPQGDFAAIAESRLAALKEAEAAKAAAAQVATAAPAPVQSGPALEVLDKDMVASHAAPLREAPEIRAKQVGRLKEGESVHVAGKVKGGDWYAVESKGQALAYVASAVLEDPADYRAQKEQEREKVKEREQEQEKEREAAQRAAVAAPAPAPAAASAPATQIAKAPPAATASGKATAADGRYKGTLTCAQIPNSTWHAVTVDAVVVVNGAQAEFSRDVLSMDGKQVVAKETARGSIAGDGSVSLTGGADGPGWHFDSSFEGKLKDGKFELSGKERIPRPGGQIFVRDCTVSLSRQ